MQFEMSVINLVYPEICPHYWGGDRKFAFLMIHVSISLYLPFCFVYPFLYAGLPTFYVDPLTTPGKKCITKKKTFLFFGPSFFFDPPTTEMLMLDCREPISRCRFFFVFFLRFNFIPNSKNNEKISTKSMGKGADNRDYRWIKEGTKK